MKTLIFAAILGFMLSLALAQPSELNGFPINFLSTANGSSDPDRGPLVADITGDGIPEIIVIGISNPPGAYNHRNRIFVYDINNTTTPAYELVIATQADPVHADYYAFMEMPAVGDIDGDGLPELIACAVRSQEYSAGDCPDNNYHYNATCTHYFSILHAWWFRNGNPPVLVYQLYNDEGFIMPTMADITQYASDSPDGKDDMVFSAVNSQGGDHLNCHDEDQRLSGYAWDNALVAVSYDASEYYPFHAKALAQNRFRERTNCISLSYGVLPIYIKNISTPSVGDCNHDGVLEVYTVMFNNPVHYDGTEAYAKLYWYESGDIPGQYSTKIIEDGIRWM
jgi:hypothetical protein